MQRKRIRGYVWDLMVCFGCRSHEVWFVDMSAVQEGGNTIWVPPNTKIKRERTAYALPRVWLDATSRRYALRARKRRREQFGLRGENPIPELDPKLTNGALGTR